jgi:hypothetical protein
MALDCSRLFPGSHLYLLVWDVSDEHAHCEGLGFVAECMEDSFLRSNVMSLLRPAGRQESDYAAFDLAASAVAGSGLPFPAGRLPGAGESLPCCELWMQVAPEAEGVLWQRVVRFARGRLDGSRWKAWRSRRQPLWQPYSSCFIECGYAETAKAPCHPRASEALLTLRNLEPDRTTWFLKLLWYRSTEVIAEEVRKGRRRTPGQRKEIVPLLGRCLSEFVPADYGVAELGQLVDPSAFCASHMPAFAIRALFTGLQAGLTWPCWRCSRGDYLGWVDRELRRLGVL